MDRKRIVITVLVLWGAALQGLRAQEAMERQEADNPSSATGWYVGLEGGMPFGISTFSSFGADKTRIGYAIGIYGGYRLNPVLSTELSMKWGKTALSARECCAASSYWLGADGTRYYAPVADMEGWDYAGLKSSVDMQRYGVRLNVNLLGFFHRTRQSRWTLELSPELAAAGTRAILKTIVEDTEVRKGTTNWHLGVGGNLQTSYALTKNLKIGIYSDITWLSGSRMDGIPEHLHTANYIWESGVRIGWMFGKGGARRQKSMQRAVPEALVRPVESTETHAGVTVCPEDNVPDTLILQTPVWPEQQTENKIETEIIAVETEEEARLVFPTAYFAFNRTDIAPDETAKLEEIKKLLQAHPDVLILVTGWCDRTGSRAVNDRISLRRAEAVKIWLIGHGIAAERIRTQGGGIDYNEPDRRKARCATTEQQGKEEQPW